MFLGHHHTDTAKFVFVGGEQVGKTSLIKRTVASSVDPFTAPSSSSLLTYWPIQSSRGPVETLETLYDRRFKKSRFNVGVLHSFTQDRKDPIDHTIWSSWGDAIVFVYSIDSLESYQEVFLSMRFFLGTKKLSVVGVDESAVDASLMLKVPVFLIGNKLDNNFNRQVPSREEIARDMKLLPYEVFHFEVSSKSSDNIHEFQAKLYESFDDVRKREKELYIQAIKQINSILSWKSAKIQINPTLETLGKCLRHGPLTKLSKRGFKQECYGFLFEKMFVYAKIVKTGVYHAKNAYMLQTSLICESQRSYYDYAFDIHLFKTSNKKISDPSKTESYDTYTFLCPSQTEKDLWMETGIQATYIYSRDPERIKYHTAMKQILVSQRPYQKRQKRQLGMPWPFLSINPSGVPVVIESITNYLNKVYSEEPTSTSATLSSVAKNPAATTWGTFFLAGSISELRTLSLRFIKMDTSDPSHGNSANRMTFTPANPTVPASESPPTSNSPASFSSSPLSNPLQSSSPSIPNIPQMNSNNNTSQATLSVTEKQIDFSGISPLSAAEYLLTFLHLLPTFIPVGFFTLLVQYVQPFNLPSQSGTLALKSAFATLPTRMYKSLARIMLIFQQSCLNTGDESIIFQLAKSITPILLKDDLELERLQTKPTTAEIIRTLIREAHLVFPITEVIVSRPQRQLAKENDDSFAGFGFRATLNTETVSPDFFSLSKPEDSESNTSNETNSLSSISELLLGLKNSPNANSQNGVSQQSSEGSNKALQLDNITRTLPTTQLEGLGSFNVENLTARISKSRTIMAELLELLKSLEPVVQAPECEAILQQLVITCNQLSRYKWEMFQEVVEMDHLDDFSSVMEEFYRTIKQGKHSVQKTLKSKGTRSNLQQMSQELSNSMSAFTQYISTLKGYDAAHPVTTSKQKNRNHNAPGSTESIGVVGGSNTGDQTMNSSSNYSVILEGVLKQNQDNSSPRQTISSGSLSSIPGLNLQDMGSIDSEEQARIWWNGVFGPHSLRAPTSKLISDLLSISISNAQLSSALGLDMKTIQRDYLSLNHNDLILGIKATKKEHKTLRKILDPQSTGFTNLITFSQFVKAFGGIQKCAQSFLNFAVHRGFYGYLTNLEITRLLEVEDPGTYMISFENSDPSNWVISWIDVRRRIRSLKIISKPQIPSLSIDIPPDLLSKVKKTVDKPKKELTATTEATTASTEATTSTEEETPLTDSKLNSSSDLLSPPSKQSSSEANGAPPKSPRSPRGSKLKQSQIRSFSNMRSLLNSLLFLNVPLKTDLFKLAYFYADISDMEAQRWLRSQKVGTYLLRLDPNLPFIIDCCYVTPEDRCGHIHFKQIIKGNQLAPTLQATKSKQNSSNELSSESSSCSTNNISTLNNISGSFSEDSPLNGTSLNEEVDQMSQNMSETTLESPKLSIPETTTEISETTSSMISTISSLPPSMPPPATPPPPVPSLTTTLTLTSSMTSTSSTSPIPSLSSLTSFTSSSSSPPPSSTSSTLPILSTTLTSDHDDAPKSSRKCNDGIRVCVESGESWPSLQDAIKYYSKELQHPFVITKSLGHSAMGSVHEGSLEKLVAYLYDDIVDLAYITVFLLTYRSFTDPIKLLDALIDQYRHLDSVPNGKPYQLRLVNFFKIWFTQFSWDLYSSSIDICAPLKTFVQTDINSKFPTIANQLLNHLNKAFEEKEKLKNERASDAQNNQQPEITNNPLINGMQGDVEGGRSIMDHPIEQIAQQLFVFEFDEFAKIQPYELMGTGWMKPDKHTRTPNIVKTIATSNLIGSWVVAEILREPALKRRASLIEFFIQITDECYKMNNFHSVMVVMSSLHDSSITRLKSTWDKVSAKKRELLENIENLMSDEDNFAIYRSNFAKAPPPKLPYAGLLFRDLIHIEDGSPKHLPNGAINFHRCELIAEKLHMVKLCQQEQLKWKRNEDLWYYIQAFPKYHDAQASYQRSLEIEPRATTSSPASPATAIATTPRSVSEQNVEGMTRSPSLSNATEKRLSKIVITSSNEMLQSSEEDSVSSSASTSMTVTNQQQANATTNNVNDTNRAGTPTRAESSNSALTKAKDDIGSNKTWSSPMGHRKGKSSGIAAVVGFMRGKKKDETTQEKNE